MGKSRAEIQKEYRERKKAKNKEGYLKAERERQRNYYVPAANLSQKKRKQRNYQNKLRNQKSQAKKAAILRRLRVREQSDDEQSSESGYGSFTSTSRGENSQLIVRLPAIKLPARGNGAKKTRARALAKAHKYIKKLKNQKGSLERRLKTKNKQLERMQKKMKCQESKTSTFETTLTPRRKTEVELKKLGLTNNCTSDVRRKLLLTNVMLSEMKETKDQSTRKKRLLLHRMVAGKVALKYRCLKGISPMTGLSRRSLGQCKSKSLSAVVERRACISKKLASKVDEFLGREDNCRAQPGKADQKKGKQTKVLTDYMRNLHTKFTAENPGTSISLATFCRLRPKHILLARFIARNACQCLRHQNMALKVQTMRKLGLKISENPENVCVHKDQMKERLENACSEIENVKFRIWKRVELENKTKKMMVVEEEVHKEVFIDIILREIEEFSEHVTRLRAQYSQLKANKEKLKEHEMIVQMDFAENYTCRSLDEVQTAYWSLTSVTIHPVVVYMKDGDELKHRSFVVISDTMTHSSSTVCSFIDKLIPELKKIDPDLTKIHYWTDSPSSQYRNRFIFYTVANHSKLYDCEAQWNYFEAGHGKSACDGLGGTVKRMADEATRQGNVLIQNPSDFFRWAVSSSMKEVAFVYVDKGECEMKHETLSKLKIKALRNTMKIHAVVFQKENAKIMKTKITSCYCDSCSDGNFCSLWRDEIIEYVTDDTDVDVETETVIEVYFEEQNPITDITEVMDTREDDIKATQETQEILQPITNTEEEMTNEKEKREEKGENNATVSLENLSAGCFVIAQYDNVPYVGKVEEVDLEDQDCRGSFMENAKSLYRWPKRADVLWVNVKDIFCIIGDPKETGKSKRLYKLEEKDQEIIDTM